MASTVALRATPALLNTRLTRPWSATTSRAHASIASRSATSSGRQVTLTPCPSQRAAVSAMPRSSTSAKARWAPRRARSVARVRPMPDPAPVMAATLPVKGDGERGRGDVMAPAYYPGVPEYLRVSLNYSNWQAEGAGLHAARVIRSPLTGTVVAVMVEPGQEIAPGTGVAIVESASGVTGVTVAWQKCRLKVVMEPGPQY